jgi:hypothetical protein
VRCDVVNLNIILRGLLSSPNGATFLPEEGFSLVPLERVYVLVAWLAGQCTTHLCVASNIRAMPETEIPPVLRGDIYFIRKFEISEFLIAL